MKNDILERLDLISDRIEMIPDEIDQMRSASSDLDLLDFFYKNAVRITYILNNRNKFPAMDINKADLQELQERNTEYYKDILGDNYETSYSNPDYADEKLGIYGSCLSFVAAELINLPVIFQSVQPDSELYTDRLYEAVVLLELFVYLYGIFKDESKPKISEVEDAIYYYAYDYAEMISEQRFYENTFLCEGSTALWLMDEADLFDVRSLYLYGDYISDTEIKMYQYLSSLDQEDIDKLAFSFTDGFRRGYDVMGVDFEGKKYVNIRYSIGQERIVKAAKKQFEEMGLKTVISRSCCSRLVRKGVVKTGYIGSSPNRQFEYDHRLDDRLFLDLRYVQRRIDAASVFYKKYEDDIKGFAGPAVIETFGEKQFIPVVKSTVDEYSPEQKKLFSELYNKLGNISNTYLPGDSYSFTIIAFPIPDIGDDFEEIFNETVKINTLDNDKYKAIQQRIIDVLDVSDKVRVIGMNGNKTDMTVKMRRLENPDKETQFENCTADVNIPLGEVFTSPVLKGTYGTLNVSSSFLNGFSFKNLTFSFEDGVVTSYSCHHEDGEEAGKRYIKENILFNHETLPIGEFAIGTNTYAYSMAERFNILEKLPILIVEKTGPHFALGDTCYSHAEDHAVFNPDGKEIISRENDFSILRDTEPDKAYFNCHTDITIPYNELGRLYVVMEDGTEKDIILEGRFVLEGTEELNEAL